MQTNKLTFDRAMRSQPCATSGAAVHRNLPPSRLLALIAMIMVSVIVNAASPARAAVVCENITVPAHDPSGDDNPHVIVKTLDANPGVCDVEVVQTGRFSELTTFPGAAFVTLGEVQQPNNFIPAKYIVFAGRNYEAPNGDVSDRRRFWNQDFADTSQSSPYTAFLPGDSDVPTVRFVLSGFTYNDPNDITRGFTIARITMTGGNLANSAPNANAGQDQSVLLGTTVNLSGAASSDLDRDALTYSWQQVTATGSSSTPTSNLVTINNPSAVSASFVAPPVTSDTDLFFKLTVDDGNGGTDEDWVRISVIADATAPTVTSVTPSTETPAPGSTMTLTVVFNESMDTATTPTITFPVENPSTVLSFSSGNWPTVDTYVATYNVAGPLTDNFVLANIDVAVTTATDVAGNAVDDTSADAFSLDIAENTPPTISSVTTSNVRPQPGSTLTLAVRFSEEMDTSSTPAIGFPVEDPSPVLSFVSGSWTASDTYTVTYSVSASLENTFELGSIDVSAADGLDLAGNAVSDTQANTFALIVNENTLPTIVSITPSTETPAPGASITIAVTFSEAMNQAITPAMTFPNENPSAVLTASGGSWTSPTTYTATYDVIATLQNDFNLPDIDVAVAAAQDIAGNIANETVANAFSLTINENTPPELNGISAAPGTITDTVTQFKLIATFNEPMITDGSADPTFGFSDPLATGILSLSSGIWTSGTVFEATYSVTDSNIAVASVDVTASGGRDESGNAAAAATVSGVFVIDQQQDLVAAEQKKAVALTSMNANRVALRVSRWQNNQQIRRRFRQRGNGSSMGVTEQRPFSTAIHSNDVLGFAGHYLADSALELDKGIAERFRLAGSSEFDIYFSMGYADQNLNSAVLDYDGHLWFGTVGIDRFVTDDLLIGVKLTIEDVVSEVQQTFLTDVSKRGLGGGIYAGYRLKDWLIAETGFDYRRFDNKAITYAASTHTGSFHSDRIAGYANLTSETVFDDVLRIASIVRVDFFHEAFSAYVTDNGADVSAHSIAEANASFGQQFELIDLNLMDAVLVSPYFTYDGIWNLQRDGPDEGLSELGLSLGGGFKSRILDGPLGGFHLALDYRVDHVTENLDSWSAALKFGKAF